MGSGARRRPGGVRAPEEVTGHGGTGLPEGAGGGALRPAGAPPATTGGGTRGAPVRARLAGRADGRARGPLPAVAGQVDGRSRRRPLPDPDRAVSLRGHRSRGIQRGARPPERSRLLHPQGHGYEVHDGRRYDWSAGDLVVVHNDSRHQHFNASPTEPALAIVVKPKCTWMMLGLTQQGRDTTVPEGEAAHFGPRQDWSRLWTPGVERLRKVVHAEEEPWQDTPDGRIKWLARRGMDVRLFGIDVWLEQLAPGPAPRHWHMADELYYVLEGSGHTLEWQVEAEIAERYYARVALQPRRHEWSAGDVVYVPQNTVHQHVAGAGGVLLLGAQNRLFRLLGYDATVYPDLEPDRADPIGEAARA